MPRTAVTRSRYSTCQVSDTVNMENVDEYLRIVFGTMDRDEIARRMVNSPTYSVVLDAYNDYEKYCIARAIKAVPAHVFLNHICDTYGLAHKNETRVNEFGNTVGYTVFYMEE